MRLKKKLVFVLTVMFAAGAALAIGGQGSAEDQATAAVAQAAVAEEQAQPGILLGKPQQEHWEDGASECPKVKRQNCADEISEGQFVAWPFIAEHTGTVEAIFAVLGTSGNTGAEVGIYANRTYAYPEIDYIGEAESSGEIWTPAMFKEYESEIPPEDPGKLLGVSGKVAEGSIKNQKFTEFKLLKPVKVKKGEKYWLANTTFAATARSGARAYQRFYHERVSGTEGQPWGDYSNEPTNWGTVARPLKELESPETSKVNCEKCNTESWLQEEPKGFDLVNENREAQEEGGQTYSYAYGKIEEGAVEVPVVEEAPTVVTKAASEVKQSSAALNATVNPNGTQVSQCAFEYGPGVSYGHTASCAPSPGAGSGAVAVSASVTGLAAASTYHFRVVASNAAGTSDGVDQTFATPASATTPSAPTGVIATAASKQALVSWTAPSSNGGSAITSYAVTPYVGASAQTPVEVAASATSTTVKGLTNGTSYTFVVTASNAVGTGTPSSNSSAVTPQDTLFELATPTTIDSNDNSSVELGVKFSSEVAGAVTGVRFYKAAANTGTHIGSLWSASGTLLASATFSGETASGWQQVKFATPVAIAANTTYVVGYLAPNGRYSDSSLGFSVSGMSNPPLVAPSNILSANGVYTYSKSSTFPASTYKATNYWVDVEFEP